MILEEWNFDPEFVEIVEQAKNWSRDTGKPADYCDVVLAARLVYRQEVDDSPVEQLRELPVIQKLRLFEIDEKGDFFLDKVRSEVAEMQQLLDSM
jgi:HD-like signal output (HDOD) protein